MITTLQKKTSQAIINIFETGQVLGDYGKVTVLSGDSGHLSYGRSQVTLASGNLYRLIKAYCENQGARYGNALSPYLTRIKQPDFTLDNDEAFKNLLSEAGNDPVMQGAQDHYLDNNFWNPSVKTAGKNNSSSSLGIAVFYDGNIQGSLKKITNKTNEKYGVASDISEQAWIKDYVNVRHDWLAHNSNQLLHKTIYRMDAFNELITSDKWDLTLPLFVRGVTINGDSLSGAYKRLLKLTSPLMRGDDVKEIQQALINRGFNITADGTFGQNTKNAVIAFQKQNGLSPDGKVGNSTRSRLLSQ